MNPLAWVLSALRVHPEPPSLPEELEVGEASLIDLAEARSRLATFASVATALRRLVDIELAGRLEGLALRYGEEILRPTYRGAPRVTEPSEWWHFLAEQIRAADPVEVEILLSALYPASALRLGGLKLLSELSGQSEESIRDTFLHYDPPTSPLSAMPRSRAPKFLQDLEEGQVR